MKRFLLALLLPVVALAQVPKTKINNGQLTTDFDLNAHQLLNWSPSQTWPNGFITDAMVNGGAAIAQSKLNLNGTIPIAWLGVGALTAAAGNDSRLSDFRTANALRTATTIAIKTTDPSDGQVLKYVLADAAWEPGSVAGTGTVTSFSAGTLSPLFTTSVATSTSTPALSFVLTNATGTSWFGNASGSSGSPSYNTTAIPAALIPSLPGSQIGSGTVANARLTTAVQRLVAGSNSLSGSSPSIDWSLGTIFHWTLSAASSPTFSNSTDGWWIEVDVTNTASNYVLTWPVAVHWVGGSQPVQTIGVHTDAWGFWNDNGTIYGTVIQNY